MADLAKYLNSDQVEELGVFHRESSEGLVRTGLPGIVVQDMLPRGVCLEMYNAFREDYRYPGSDPISGDSVESDTEPLQHSVAVASQGM
jgi:hypothetical protein